MKTIAVLTAAVAAALSLAASSGAHIYRPGCNASLAPKAELHCARLNRQHAQATIEWARRQLGRPQLFDAQATLLLSRIFKNHRWLYRAMTARIAQAEHRLDRRASPPGWWYPQAACIRSREGAWTSNTGNGYYGAYQFLLSTWESVGGRGFPYLAPAGEQTYRAWLVWRRDGGSWREWSTAGACGLN